MRASVVAAFFDRLVSGCAVVVGILIMLSVVLVTADVGGRYFLAAPIGWVLEVTEYILLCVPFLGMAWLVRRAEGHVRIDLLTQALPPEWEARLAVFTSLLAAATCGFATYLAIETTVDHYVRGVETYGIYPFPKFIPIMVVAFGLALTTVEFVRRAFAGIR